MRAALVPSQVYNQVPNLVYVWVLYDKLSVVPLPDSPSGQVWMVMQKCNAVEHMNFVCEFNSERFSPCIKNSCYALISSDMCAHPYLCARVYANIYIYTYFILH